MNESLPAPNSPFPYADVAVNRPIRPTYTYRIPPALAAWVRPGSMVRVPVRGQSAEGVVVRLSSTSPTPDAKLKDIAQVLTPEYAIPPDLLKLGEWMSEYYLAGPGEALATIAFFGLTDQQSRTERLLALSEEGLHVASSQILKTAPPLPSSPPPVRLTDKQTLVLRALIEACNEPLTPADLRLRAGCSESVLEGLLKRGLLREDRRVLERHDAYGGPLAGGEPPHALTSEQQVAFDRIVAALEARRFQAFLLHGITGSGKTEVYLQAIARTLELGRQAIVLVPEISLTPQAVARFRQRFGDRVGVYHSNLNRGQKYDLWKRIASGQVQVLIGARSAVFAPFPRLGLVVVDEEHEHSYKQSDPAPRYHARDVAVWRARQAAAPALLGSATPALESLLNARPTGEGHGKYTLLELTERAGDAVLPDVRLIDMAAQVRDQRDASLVSEPLRQAIAERLERHEQVVLFLNRRGFSNFLLCLACKTAIRCDHCDVVMTWHKAIGQLMCHFCGATRPRPAECPECGTPDPAAMGAGTQRIEEDITALFPEARLLRIDLDTTRGKEGFLHMWKQIEDGRADILLGTQMIAKGLHLERVTLVGVISADHSLFLPDFRASERAFSQLTQVAGRAGRARQRGEVLIQTFVPNHYAIQRAVVHDAHGFWDQELHIRQMLRFPPYWRLLLARLSGPDSKQVAERAARLAHLLRDRQAHATNRYRSLTVLGPVPSPIARIQDKTRWQLLIRGQRPDLMRGLMLDALETFERDKARAGVSLSLDMDPMDLL